MDDEVCCGFRLKKCWWMQNRQNERKGHGSIYEKDL